MLCWWRQRAVGLWGALALVVGVTGCSIHPLPEDVSRISTVDIVRSIRCEAKNGLAGFEGDQAAHGIIAATVIGFDFSFDISESNSATQGVLNFERGSGGLSKLDFDARAYLSRGNKRNFQIIEDLADLKKAKCSGEAGGANPVYPITGAIGMDEVVRTFIKLDRLMGFKKIGVPGGFSGQGGFGSNVIFSDDIEFTTTVKAGAAPELVLNAGIGSLAVTKASIIGSMRRYDKHSVIVALVHSAPQPPDDVATGPAKKFAAGPVTKIQYDAKTRQKLQDTKMKGDELIATVRDPRVQAALIQAHADTRTSVVEELRRKRKLRDDQVEPASALGERFLEILKLP
jgi:hypothetical protein